jgi:sugar O-acyltransferase (sialic acid O-acetyltransferase NeuD family)
MKYYIIGKGGFAKEVLFLCKEVFGHLEDFNGFIDYKPNDSAIVCLGLSFPVIDEDEFLSKNKGVADMYLGVGDPTTISKVVEKFKGFTFPNLVHRSVVKDESVITESGNIFTAGCILTVDIKIGNFNIFNLNTTIGHDTKIGDYNVFNPGVNVSGSVTIENKNLFGTNSTILQGLSIGSNSIIGASSLINKCVNNNLVIVGVPGKVIRKNDESSNN